MRRKNTLQKETVFLFVCLGLCVLLTFIDILARKNAYFTEILWSRSVYHFFSQIFSFVSGLLPVSLSEIILFLLPVLLGLSVCLVLSRRKKLKQIISLWLAFVFLGFSMYQAWAVNYSRQTYGEIAGLNVKAVEIDKLVKLNEKLAQQANDLKERMGQTDSAYALDVPRENVMQKVCDAYKAAGDKYPWLKGFYGRPKLAMTSVPLAYLGIAGIFSPVTVEAHVNNCESDVLLAATATHEAAHLRGFAREDEANYIAYAVCMESEDDYFRYSGTVLGILYAGNALYAADRDAYLRIYETYCDGLIEDLRAYNAAWKPYEGKAQEVNDKVNDKVLKANGQTDGVRSYGRMIDLMIAEMEKEE